MSIEQRNTYLLEHMKVALNEYEEYIGKTLTEDFKMRFLDYGPVKVSVANVLFATIHKIRELD